MQERLCDNIKKNSGFSLVEVLIVIVIMIILASLAALSYKTVMNAQVSEAAHTLDSAINTAIAQTMAKGEEAGRLTIYFEDDVMYYTIGDPATATKERICGANIDVYFVTSEGYDVRPGTHFASNGSFSITFNSNGTFKESSTGYQYTKFTFNYDNRYVEVILYVETGKHEVNMYYR